MIVGIAIAIVVALGASFGWKGRLREGTVAAVLLSAIVGLVAAFTISLPTEVGGLWMFGIAFVVLTAASLAGIGIAHCIRRFVLPG